MNHDNAPFEIHVHGDVPIKPGTDLQAVQEALKPLWHYAGARSLSEGSLSLYEEEPGIRFDLNTHRLHMCWTVRGDDDFRMVLDDLCMNLNELSSAGTQIEVTFYDTDFDDEDEANGGESRDDFVMLFVGPDPGAIMQAQRDLLEFRQTLEASCAYYAALRATEVDRERLTAAFEALQDCYARDDKVSRAEEGAADARFHLAIAEASHNAVLLHTIRGLFDLLKRNVVTNIGGMYKQRSETRDMLIAQHRDLYLAIVEGRAHDAREVSSRHILYVQEVLEEVRQEVQRVARAERRNGR